MMELHHAKKTYVPRPGPMSVLLNRLHQIAWSWKSGSMFQDQHERPIDLLYCNIQELRERLEDAWQQRVKNLVGHRQTFAGIQWTSSYLTTCDFHKHAAEDQALLRTSLNGTFFTADRTKHRSDTPDIRCKFCGKDDSQVHRHWTCTALALTRTVSPDQALMISEMQPCIAAHGWMPEPPSLRKFQSCLLSTPEAYASHQWPCVLPKVVHAFTDGSCLNPTCKLSRVASWGVVISDEEFNTFWPLSCGMVPGWTQTALRGEIWAAISACEFGLQSGRPVHIWTDNDLVYKRLRQFTSQPCFFKPNQKDADLWRKLYNVVHLIGAHNVGTTKVCSHQQINLAVDAFEEWVFRGNSEADLLAESVFISNTTFSTLHSKLVDEIAQIRILRNHVHRTIIQIGRKAVTAQPLPDGDKKHAARIRKEELAETDLSNLALESLTPKYLFDHAGETLQWLGTLTDRSETVKCVSWFQLYALYEYQTGLTGMRHVRQKKQWVSGAKDVKYVDFVRRTNYFSDWVQGILKLCSRPGKFLHLRPESSCLQFWTQCICLRIRTGVLNRADEILMMQQPKVNSVKALRNF